VAGEGEDRVDIELEGGAPIAPGGVAAADVWIEILAPVEQARSIIGRALQELPNLPAGLSIGASERGTILLNAKAWATFHSPLKALNNLQIQHPHDPKPPSALKFYVLT